MECLGGDVNRMVCRGGWGLVLDWIGIGDGGDGNWGDGVKSGFRRLCVVCATTEICCKCNNFIQIHAPG